MNEQQVAELGGVAAALRAFADHLAMVWDEQDAEALRLLAEKLEGMVDEAR